MSCIVAGTFDHFHKGHEKVLDCAINTGKHLKIYLVQDNSYLTNCKQYSEYIEPYFIRERHVRTYVEEYTTNFEIIPMSTIYADVIIRTDIDTIVCCEDLKDKCKMINILRNIKGREPLQIITVDLDPDISSAKIRAQWKDIVED